jgi:hypothetical protein
MGKTGIDKTGSSLRLGWVKADGSLDCLRISCTGDNTWAKILTDSDDIATFGTFTPLCLEDPRRSYHCGRNGRTTLPTYNPEQPFHLCTWVRPQGEDYYSRKTQTDEAWTLRPLRQYCIGPKDLRLVATVKINDHGFVLIIKESMIYDQVFRRTHKRTVLRETFERGAVECLVTERYEPTASVLDSLRRLPTSQGSDTVSSGTSRVVTGESLPIRLPPTVSAAVPRDRQHKAS